MASAHAALPTRNQSSISVESSRRLRRHNILVQQFFEILVLAFLSLNENEFEIYNNITLK